MSKLWAFLQKWGWRYVKYNIIGVLVFLLNIAFYYIVFFPVMGESAYIIVSIIGGIVEFLLITYVNKTRQGVIFESCSPKEATIGVELKSSNKSESGMH